jgi:hypothetical protein
MRPAKVKNKYGKVALFAMVRPETHGNLTRRSFEEQKSLGDIIEETFGFPREPKKEPVDVEEFFANLT